MHELWQVSVAPKFIFFTGKGGTGKTSMACATATWWAGRGERTLIVTTDPASNLGDVFEQDIGHRVVPIIGVANLWAVEIDPDEAAAEYRERVLAPLRGVFPQEMIDVVSEQLRSPCTAEVAAFDKFVDFMAESDFSVVIFDTAPTGHTLRLLELPVDWSQHIQDSAKGSGQTCIGPVDTLQVSKGKYDRAISLMCDPEKSRFIFVLHPEAIAVAETLRTSQELAKIGIRGQELIINGILSAQECQAPLFRHLAEQQAEYLEQIRVKLPLPSRRMFLLDEEIKGVDSLKRVAAMLYCGAAQPARASLTPVSDSGTAGGGTGSPLAPSEPSRVTRLLLPTNGRARVIFYAGKGGVGKTTLSCLTAVWLARCGYRTLLLTTDPAAHLAQVLEQPVLPEPSPVGSVSNLWSARIDARQAAEEYKERILVESRKSYSSEMLASLAEELESPCTEEIAVFDRFITCMSLSGYEAMVLDTAPTGHTLRLLELPVAWSRQLEVKAFASLQASQMDAEAKARFGEVINMMRDTNRTTFVQVMYPEWTPIIEAYRATKELETVGIRTGLVVANMVLPPEQCTNDFFSRRRRMQEKYLAEIRQRFSVPLLEIPVCDREIRGLPMLQEVAEGVFGKCPVACL